MKTKEINTQQISSIKLPKSFRNGKAFVIQNKDTLTIKKIQTSSLSEIRQKLKLIQGTITEEEIDQEVQRYRKGK